MVDHSVILTPSFIRWVLNTIDGLHLPNPPVLALLPLGTGNDLGRTLGYGAGGDTHDVE